MNRQPVWYLNAVYFILPVKQHADKFWIFTWERLEENHCALHINNIKMINSYKWNIIKSKIGWQDEIQTRIHWTLMRHQINPLQHEQTNVIVAIMPV